MFEDEETGAPGSTGRRGRQCDVGFRLSDLGAACALGSDHTARVGKQERGPRHSSRACPYHENGLDLEPPENPRQLVRGRVDGPLDPHVL